jgi:hypothetical protein
LVERVDAAGKAVGADFVMSVCLAADVVGVLMPGGGDGQVGIARIVVGLVEMVKRRDGEEGFG